MNRFVYLDNNATTKISDSIRTKIMPYLDLQFGNPSSPYNFGKQVKSEMAKSREVIAKFINCESKNIVFTSSGSEGNCSAINSAIRQFPTKKKIITTKVEHSSILEYCKILEKQGYVIICLNVDNSGNLDLIQLEKEIDNNTACVSIQYGNNETGVIVEIDSIIKIIESKKKGFNFVFHMDCVQALAKTKLDMQRLNADICSFSGHKIHAPKGCGFIYIKEPKLFTPLIAGHQEFNLRGGTENVVGIIAMGESIKNIKNNFENSIKNMQNLQKYLESQLEIIPGVNIIAKNSNRLPNTTSVRFDTINGNELMFKLEKFGVCVSTGSACNSESSEPSHVLKAMGLTKLENIIRVSIDNETTKKQIDYFIENLKRCL